MLHAGPCKFFARLIYMVREETDLHTLIEIVRPFLQCCLLLCSEADTSCRIALLHNLLRYSGLVSLTAILLPDIPPKRDDADHCWLFAASSEYKGLQMAVE